jgi:hypothetical protein
MQFYMKRPIDDSFRKVTRVKLLSNTWAFLSKVNHDTGKVRVRGQ